MNVGEAKAVARQWVMEEASRLPGFHGACIRGSTTWLPEEAEHAARPIAIDGSRELIEGGRHREAIFWIVATYARCLTVLHYDGTSGQRERADRGFQRLLGDLGIASSADLKERSEGVAERMPRVWEVAEAIMSANPGIEE